MAGSAGSPDPVAGVPDPDVTAVPEVEEAIGDPAEGEIEPETDAVLDYDSADHEAEVSESWSPHRLAILVGVALVVALAGLTGWLGYQTYQSHKAEQRHQLFLQVARQAALNLTTIDWEHVDADVQRVLDSATGSFHDEFQERSAPFVEVVKKAQSKSVGTVTEAGVESASDENADVILAMSVKTTMANQPEQRPRSWRMRVTVQKVGDEAKVSNVTFVP